MALNVDKNNLPKVGQDFRTAQELARSKVQANPFGAVKMDRVEVSPDPTYTQQAPVQQPVRQEPVRQQPAQQPRMVQQPQTRPVQNRTTQNERPQAHITANGRVIKTSVNGNTYSYEDKFDHSKDVMLEQDAKFLLRLPKEHKDYLERLAKAERTSLNQLIVRAINSYVGSNRR